MKRKAFPTPKCHNRGSILAAALGAIIGLVLCTPICAQESENVERISWERGPALVNVGHQAKIDLPRGYLFAHESDAKIFLELSHNLPTGCELGILAPTDLSWFVIFSFDEIGHVPDDEKDRLDADSILGSIRRATAESNEERTGRGWDTMTVVGWIEPPHYDSNSHNLEWSLEGRNGRGDLVANHYTRLLGRKGVMSAELVVGMADLYTYLPAFQGVIQGFSYTPDNSYLAFVRGDKVAKYGLTGLIIGGVAAKTGLLKYLWKLVVAAIAGFAALLKRLFSPRCRETVRWN